MLFETLMTKELLLSVVGLAFVVCLIIAVFELATKIEFMGEED